MIRFIKSSFIGPPIAANLSRPRHSRLLSRRWLFGAGA
jgi:hypothetical protein